MRLPCRVTDQDNGTLPDGIGQKGCRFLKNKLRSRRAHAGEIMNGTDLRG